MGRIRKHERLKGTTYEAEVRLKGQPSVQATFKTLKEANEWITLKEASILQTGTASRETIEKTTIKEVLEAFLLPYETEARTPRGKIVYDEVAMKKAGFSMKKVYNVLALQDYLGSFTIKTLTHTVIEKFLKKMVASDIPAPTNRTKIHKNYNGAETKQYTPATVRKYYFDLKVAVELWAFKNNFDLGNRFTNQNIPESWNPRERRLEKGELDKLLLACNKMLKAPEQWKLIIQFAIETAMRPSEYLQLEFKDLHLAQHERFLVVRPDTTKNEISRQVPLSRRALEILSEMESKSTTKKGRVFHLIPHSAFSAGFKCITLNAKCDNLKAHDLRHEGISRFFENNLNLSTLEIMKITSHTEMKTILRYANLRPELLADKMDQKKSDGTL